MKKYSGQFRSATWDPILIISQIVALQAVFYFSLGGILCLMDLLFGSSRSLDHLFKYQEIHVRDLGGKLVIAGFVINALLGSLGLWFIVERTKQCLDFSSTTHLIHLIACWNYNSSFPNTISWWLLNIACLTIMCVSGEFLCLRNRHGAGAIAERSPSQLEPTGTTAEFAHVGGGGGGVGGGCGGGGRATATTSASAATAATSGEGSDRRRPRATSVTMAIVNNRFPRSPDDVFPSPPSIS